MVILQDLLFLYQAVAETKAIPSWSMALAAFSSSPRCFSPFTCSMCVLSRDGKMGCSALKTHCVHSSLGIVLPAVWIPLALSSNECVLAQPSKGDACGGGRAGGSAAFTHGRHLHCLDLCCWQSWCIPLSLLEGVPGVLAHVLSILLGLIACWAALMCPKPRSAPSVGVNPPSLASRDERTGAGTVGRNVQAAHVLCPPDLCCRSVPQPAEAINQCRICPRVGSHMVCRSRRGRGMPTPKANKGLCSGPEYFKA